jgi:hypothetical protein
MPAGLANVKVGGNVIVQEGAVFVMGCPPKACTSVIGGNVIGERASGIIVHGTTIGGSALQRGGGNGGSCETPTTGFFGFIHHPGFSVYDGDNIGRNVEIKEYKSCWLGVTHSRVGGSVDLIKNNLADPDAIEVLDNTISRNLVCRENKPTVWDSADLSETGALFPRMPLPNRVGGERVGQCVTASPPGSGPF